MSVSFILKFLAPLLEKKVSCIKGANKQNHFKQNTLSEEKNGTCKDLILAYYKPLIAENVIMSLRRQ